MSGAMIWEEMTEQQKWNQIKYQRDLYLQQCDWTQLPDAVFTIEEKAAWQDYRQALRDIPQTFNSPDEVVYPVMPGA
jgi:hypothetical protein